MPLMCSTGLSLQRTHTVCSTTNPPSSTIHNICNTTPSKHGAAHDAPLCCNNSSFDYVWCSMHRAMIGPDRHDLQLCWQLWFAHAAQTSRINPAAWMCCLHHAHHTTSQHHKRSHSLTQSCTCGVKQGAKQLQVNRKAMQQEGAQPASFQLQVNTIPHVVHLRPWLCGRSDALAPVHCTSASMHACLPCCLFTRELPYSAHATCSFCALQSHSNAATLAVNPAMNTPECCTPISASARRHELG